jgi:acetyltransferase
VSVLNLERMMQPRSVALIGASERPASVGRVIMQNLLDGGFSGPVYPVNPRHASVLGVPAFAGAAALPDAPDLAVVCTPPATVPGIIDALGRRGTRAAVVITAGLREHPGDGNLEERMLRAAGAHRLRILGPNCIGLLLPRLGLNASFAHTGSAPGRLAFLSQSGALCTTVLDWARSRGIGFSCFASLGDSADVDFGDLLDYLGSDPATRGILLYIESIRNPRKFLSAARATSRNKTVIAIKAGRFEAGARAALSHTGALAGRDDVFDAAIRRAGMLRVHTIEDLFDAAETLAYARPLRGKRLVMLTNGGGPGVLAVDQLAAQGGVAASLSAPTLAGLDACLPHNWSRGNPVDIIGDAGADRYVKALRILLADPECDALLVMLVPTAIVDNLAVARGVAAELKETRKPVLTCWMGEQAVADARRLFAEAGIATYDTPASAVRAFMQMVEYEENQYSLMQVPASVPESFHPQTDEVRGIIRRALDAGREVLTEPEAKAVLAAYGIPVVPTRVAADAAEAAAAAEEIGFPVALKILSADITHKSDVGGVLLDIQSPAILEAAAAGMLARVRAANPDARIEGFSVQKMVSARRGQELIVGMAEDAIFGPIILFGHGGTAVEVVADRAVSLPPLNMALAAQLIERTRISRVLKGYRDVPPVDLDAVQLTLVKVSQLVTDHNEIIELDINPLIAGPQGVIAVDARIRLAGSRGSGPERMAIRPYPRELEERISLDGTELLIRPIRPEDGPAHAEFFARLSPRDVHFRFFRAVHDLSLEQLARFTQIDYDRELALIACARGPQGRPETLGVVRAVADADNTEAEFAIIVRPDWQRRGLGRLLMDRIIRHCRNRGTGRLVGQTLMDNEGMLRLAVEFGFRSRALPEDHVMYLELPLQD